MKTLVTGAFLLLVAIRHAESQPYTVNEVRHPTCTNDDILSMDNTLTVVTGESAAPCTGYLLYDYGSGTPEIQRMCGEYDPNIAAQPLTREMAQRFCYTLGTNMYRPSNTNDQIMLFRCDAYHEAGLADTDSGASVSLYIEAYNAGKGCQSSSGDFCFYDCYELSTSDNIDDSGTAVDFACETDFWATTCSDVDECLDGVLADCTGPFPESCTKRKACGDNTVCENVGGATGGWTCGCEAGYNADTTDPYDPDEGCLDNNECEDDDICGIDGHCINTPGSYECTCLHPDLFHSNNCIQDTDECEDDDICGYHAQCINTPGSYICTCLRPELYDSDTRKCQKSTCPVLPILTYAHPASSYPSEPQYGDKVVYRCITGYQVERYAVPPSLLPYYGLITTDTFEVQCAASGLWDPYPLPVCYPVTCKDPGYVLNAQRSDSNWNYEDEVTYDCTTGYWPAGNVRGTKRFTRTCQADGTWTPGSTCDDVDECVEEPGICGVVDKYCINTPGSYLCINLNDPIPSPKPCELMSSLDLCKNGDCFMDGGKASCKCYVGYEGVACDRPVASTALIIAIVGMVLTGIVILLIIVIFCCTRALHPPHQPVIEPAYGGYPAGRGMHQILPVRKGFF